MTDFDFYEVKVECSGPYGFACALQSLSSVTGCYIFNFGSKSNFDLSWFTGYIHFKCLAGKFNDETLNVISDMCIHSIIKKLPSDNKSGVVFDIRKV